ncbi:Lar family restriction alleviation protein [Pseudomonas knackmussii]|uniref:Lar family restriction alleviation protein n=1 Tax=Pseudomonas knackmussii TaxID=65741 RepID=UPI003F4A81B7
MPELKPCPFCGDTPGEDSYALTDGGFKYGAISCGCGAVGPDVRTGYKDWPEWKDAAVAEWNERAIPSDQALVPRELLERIAKPRTSIGDVNDGIAAMAELRAILQH